MPRKRMIHCAVAGALAAIALAAPASAGFLEETEVHAFGFDLSPGSQTMGFQQFDDQGGTRLLQQVTFRVAGVIGANVTAENDSPDLPAPAFALGLTGFMTVDFAGMGTLFTFAETFATDGSVTASDGVEGSGTDFWDFGQVLALDQAEILATTDLGAFIGAGTIDADVFASGGFSVAGSTDSTVVISDFQAGGTLTVIYAYENVPGAGGIALLALAGLRRPRRRH